MAYSTPLTAVSNATLTAAQWNASVRDNLLETAPAKATATGKLIVTSGLNQIAQRTVQTASVNASQTTTSNTYTDLATVGPSVGPLTTGTFAVAFIQSQNTNNIAGAYAKSGVAVSGATTIAASDAQGLLIQAQAANQGGRAGICVGYEGTLTPGGNQFTMKYCVAGVTTGTFDLRSITVFAL